MKKIYLLIFIMTILLSCSKEEEIDPQFSDPSNMSKNLKVSKLDLALNFNDSIIPLNPEDFPQKKLTSTMNYETNEAIMQLQGVEFYIQSKNFNFGQNTLQTQGKGQEIVLANYVNDKEEQLFYIKYFPPSTGISYMIYSYKDDVPVSVGSYSSDPDNYVLYATNSDQGYTYGSSWDFLKSDSEEGYVIENQDILGGSGWNIYNYSLDSRNGNLAMEPTNKGQYQEFEIIPNYQFEIISIDFEFNQAEILSSAPVTIDEIGYSNYGDVPVTRTFTVNETKIEKTKFEEQQGITLNKSQGLDISVAVPEVFSIGSSYDIQQGSSQVVTYGTESTVSREIISQSQFIVPPYTRTVCTYTAFKHNLNVEYVAVCRAINEPDLEIVIRGVWEGVDYSSKEIVKRTYDLNNPERLLNTEIIQVAAK